MAWKLRDSVTFLPMKDLRFSKAALRGHTWFMSSMYDKQEEGEVQYQRFPSEASKGRFLCLKGNDRHDGSWNYYALAWPETLPHNATLKKGLTFVSYNHYDYGNIWHGLSAVVPFVSWYVKNNCKAVPDRWILYHWGELRLGFGPWLTYLMEATFGENNVFIENLDEFGSGDHNIDNTDSDDSSPVCFEDAVVMRHNEGGMGKLRRYEAYDMLRCKARMYCNVSDVEASRNSRIGLTLFMRTGARSFKNESVVIKIFEKECQKVQGCQLTVAYSNHLTFCEQVKVMSQTDILVSPHGAQLTNMFFMNRNSSVMEFFPKGWLKLAGVGQYVYHWIANWSGMRHQGAWRDPDGEQCPFPEDDRRCMSVFKDGRIGYNETHFSVWARNVLDQVKLKKTEDGSNKNVLGNSIDGCPCGLIA
ncbi:glycosyltransferase [Lithospermum erythrorhizon]|uniref:Glycosyltransferase n=1 Tax=Lithospermum erythrorhizon TaxID=34254 RepID=A0AAV3R458_LITER